ncbi:MAG: hypothetical protein SFW36_09880 [Leptolyngbyaceae cyanobacterium bins.59]|nr:hypothetical protein [Leptolyngbyaceae cyanobacterium bins.59]
MTKIPHHPYLSRHFNPPSRSAIAPLLEVQNNDDCQSPQLFIGFLGWLIPMGTIGST